MIVNCSECLKEKVIKPYQYKNSKSKLFFCSKQHKDDALRKARLGNKKYIKLIPNHYHDIKNCKNCNKKVKGQYCNSICKYEYNKLQSLVEWRSNPELASSKKNKILLPRFRKYLLEEANYKCSQCNWGEISFNGTIPLEIDHIDGNWTNNNKNNLRVLCPNCHSLTSNYKVYNIGNVKESKYKFYKQKNWW